MRVHARVHAALERRPQPVTQARGVARRDVLIRPRALEVEDDRPPSPESPQQQRCRRVQREVRVDELRLARRAP